MKDTLTLEPSKAGDVEQGRNEVKDEQLFARLIGAAVLLALAVIVLPFVLDGSGSQREYEYAETLPVEPQRPVVEKSYSSRQPVQDSRPAPVPAEIEVTTPEITPVTDLRPATAIVPAATTEQLASAVASAADNGQGLQQNTAPGGLLNTVPLQPGWNIQVASFVRDTNASKLLKKMHAQNLPAYANRVQGGQRTVIRVLVGPYDNRVDALALQNRIDSEYRVESLVVRGK